MKKIILFSGKAENGKTTAAGYLKEILEKRGEKVVITRYAYYLKDLAKRYCDWNGQKDEAGRELLQVLGTDIIRQKLNKPNFHVGRICEDIEICLDYVDYVIIDDTRFENEIYYPKAMFGDKVVTVKLYRTSPGFESHLSKEQQAHPSETALDNFTSYDYTIEAENLYCLYAAIDTLSKEV